MGEIVNLRKTRKAKARRAAEATATRNRIAHGRPRTERELAEKHQAQDARRLEGHRIVRPEPPDPND